MNYLQYREFKSTLDLSKYLRLDCMNPRKSMSFLNPPRKRVTPDESLLSIREAFGYGGNISFSGGVCASLRTLSSVYRDRMFYIPQEVYPVYFQMIQGLKQGYSVFGYNSFEHIQDSVIIYSLNHFGSLKLRVPDLNRLVDRGNIVIIDAVYDYRRLVKQYYPLVKSGSCYVLCSTSKTQLTHESGFVLHETATNFTPPYEYYKYDTEFPIAQCAVFNNRWAEICDVVSAGLYSTNHPYLRIADGYSFRGLLDRGILSIPMSVFSSIIGTHSAVVSPLFEIDKPLCHGDKL